MIPIKVKIGLRPNGHADHPDWQLLPLSLSDRHEDHQIVKWKYDKTSGHEEKSEDSPKGIQWGMMVVTRQFADEAMEIFPDLVFEMTEQEAEDFWDNKAHAHIPENKHDINVLQGLDLELRLKNELGEDTQKLKAKIAKALDPLDNEPGIKKGKKLWKDAKKEF